MKKERFARKLQQYVNARVLVRRYIFGKSFFLID